VVGCRTSVPSVELPEMRREVLSIVDARATVEGAGVHLRRTLGGPDLGMLDPFLLLDEMHSSRPEDFIKGFPSHPHRGFETVTYVLDGAVDHKDSLGNHGHLGPGSAQWMTAGHGIIHSEMPGVTRGAIWAFQLWVNLPAANKLVRPRYQDIAPERVPALDAEGARVRVVAGERGGQRGPVDGIVTAPTMLDVAVERGARFRHDIPEGHAAFAYVIEGVMNLGPTRRKVTSGQLAVLGSGRGIDAETDTGARMLLCAARPIGEPVARYGPFVMNTDDEIKRAIDDYRSGRLVTPG
jgi:redox-sensitive bicupin YhaK (pirin superfamily)